MASPEPQTTVHHGDNPAIQRISDSASVAGASTVPGATAVEGGRVSSPDKQHDGLRTSSHRWPDDDAYYHYRGGPPPPPRSPYWDWRRWERDRDWFERPQHRPPPDWSLDEYGRAAGAPGIGRGGGYYPDRYTWDQGERGGPMPAGARRRREMDNRDEYDTYVTGIEKNGGRRKGRVPPGDVESVEQGPMRLPYSAWMGIIAKGHFVATIGEFVGTSLFLFFAFSATQVASVGSTTTGGLNVLLYIALAFGFSLMVNVWVFFRISGGLFNPAVTLAMLLSKAISVVRACLLLVAQICGGIFASFLADVLFPGPLNVRTQLAGGTSPVRGVFIEAVLTAELVFTILMMAVEKHKATFLAPIGIGLALFIAELVGVFFTGGSLNPARSFGPCVVAREFNSEHWIYWVGPGAGAIIAVVFYRFILILQYELANPGQDEDSPESAEQAAEMAALGKTATSHNEASSAV